jgi:hypothetical protein
MADFFDGSQSRRELVVQRIMWNLMQIRGMQAVYPDRPVVRDGWLAGGDRPHAYVIDAGEDWLADESDTESNEVLLDVFIQTVFDVPVGQTVREAGRNILRGLKQGMYGDGSMTEPLGLDENGAPIVSGEFHFVSNTINPVPDQNIPDVGVVTLLWAVQFREGIQDPSQQ